MVDHSRSKPTTRWCRIIQAACDRSDIKPLPVLDVIRKRLRADEDLRPIADLPDQSLETLRQCVLRED
jgi:hypothetical protein